MFEDDALFYLFKVTRISDDGLYTFQNVGSERFLACTEREGASLPTIPFVFDDAFFYVERDAADRNYVNLVSFKLLDRPNNAGQRQRAQQRRSNGEHDRLGSTLVAHPGRRPPCATLKRHEQKRKKAVFPFDIRGAKRNFAANLKDPLFRIRPPLPPASFCFTRRGHDKGLR